MLYKNREIGKKRYLGHAYKNFSLSYILPYNALYSRIKASL